MRDFCVNVWRRIPAKRIVKKMCVQFFIGAIIRGESGKGIKIIG